MRLTAAFAQQSNAESVVKTEEIGPRIGASGLLEVVIGKGGREPIIPGFV